MASTTAERTLARSEWRVLVILGVPTFALALAITTVSTYLPVLAEDFSDSSIVIGLLIGGEGLVALWLPLVVGSWSGPPRTPLGSAAAPAAGQPAAVHPRRHTGARRRACRARIRPLDRRGRDRRRGLLRRLLRRLRALPRPLSGPRRRRDRRSRAEQSGDLPRPRDLPRPGRRRPAHLDLRSAALPGHRAHRRADDGRLLRRGRALPPP